MEEKVLIKSVSSKKTKQFLMIIVIALLIISVIFLVLAFKFGMETWVSWGSYHYEYYSYPYYRCDYCGDIVSERGGALYEHIIENHKVMFLGYTAIECAAVWFILNWSFVFLTVIFYLIYLLVSRCNITVSEKNISGRTFWGKKVVLPIHMVSAYSISKFFSVVAITTSSGFIKFPGIGNYKEIAEVLQELLNERQNRTETQSLIAKQNNSKNLDDLVKLKNLLDKDIITKEEYEVKKKEILGF